ncbi:MAG: hydroxysqualene dehydroxylase HpnE [Rhodospirillales bacterium]|nr:hydroxysqualene dehydroxylase HpnE [Rhodospirillales bacterium]
MSATVHVIGAGLAGLAAAIALVGAGRRVGLYDASPHAGGRCRSYLDRDLGLTLDNGNHLLLSGNRAAMDYLARIGARDALTGPAVPEFPFLDLATGARWTLRPNRGRIGWWIAAPSRRVPGTRVADYLRLLALARIRDDRTVSEALPENTLFHRLAAPLAIAALNTPPEQGLARLLGAVLRETLLAGGASAIPLLPRVSLGAALIEPALATLRGRGAAIHLACRIAALEGTDGRVTTLRAAEGDIVLGAEDSAVLAVPPWVAASLLPGLVVPDAFESILNLHFAIRAGAPRLLGLLGGTAEWVFVKSDHVSVTVSAANRIVDLPAEDLVARVWPEVARALSLPAALPPWRVVKEKRATFAATAAQERRRPGPRTEFANLALAGDWTATGLPATIEGAIRSGFRAAALLAPIAS